MVDNADKTILHVDMDAFFASIEIHDHPELNGLPVIIGSPRDQRGVVSTCSYEARKFGVHSGMPSRTAAQRCPEGIFLPVRMTRYQEVSRQIMEVFHTFTPYVQPLSCDEAFLDVTGSLHLFGDAPSLASGIKAAILARTGLTCSVGIAPNLFLAKIASDLNKPDGLTLVPFSPEQIPDFLADLPIKRMWGAGAKMQKTLRAHNLHTLGDLQRANPTLLANWIGERAATTFRQRAFGRDDRQLETNRIEKSISNETTFKEDQCDTSIVESALLDLVDQVGMRLRRAGFYAETAHIKIRGADFSTLTRQRRLSPPTCDDITLREVALALFQKEKFNRPIRLIGVGVSNLCDTPNAPQLDLFASEQKETANKRETLCHTVDAIRDKFGAHSLRRASAIKEES